MKWYFGIRKIKGEPNKYALTEEFGKYGCAYVGAMSVDAYSRKELTMMFEDCLRILKSKKRLKETEL